ncbi:MAG: type II toxin-antitoxin system RelE/ParE family toxin [Lachnospiraceae bacterium]|nr:type II toxin-antitoxin system RelE/ParE family toxin [Lachnospiraceae bacterium]
MYIADVLCNKEAANDLVNDVESAILERLNNPESFEPYHSLKERKYPYYRVYVKNYTIYYVVIPDGENKKIMEGRRMLHNHRDRYRYI